MNHIRYPNKNPKNYMNSVYKVSKPIFGTLYQNSNGLKT